MKHNFRIIVGMLLLAIPLCLNAQVKPVKQGQQEEQKPKTEKPEKEKPEKPKGEIDRMPKISGFVQGLYQGNFDKDFKLESNTFRMRRVRMSVEGNLAKGLSYKIQGDFINSPMLVDAFLKYKVCNEFAIQAGQFKLPFSIESPINPVNLEIFDYGEVIQNLVGYSDVCGVGGLGRDIGIMATGSLFPVELQNGQKFGLVDYSIGVFNGNGPVNFKKNEKGLDNNNHKDIVGRLDIHPWVKALTISGSYYYGQYYKDEENYGTRNRWAVGAQYNDGKLVLRGEYIGGKTGYAPTVIPEDLGYFNSNGYYAVAGYNFQAGEQKIMPVLRYEHFTKDASITNGGTNWYTVGVNYWPLKSVNFKLDYSLVQQVMVEKTYAHRVVAILSYKF